MEMNEIYFHVCISKYIYTYLDLNLNVRILQPTQDGKFGKDILYV